MSSIKIVFTLISKQFALAAREIRSLPKAPASTSGKDGQEESLRLYQEVFTLLAGGEGLPFFRPNYLEISGRVFSLNMELAEIKRQISALSADALKSVRDCLGNTDKAFSLLGLAWSRFLEDPDKAGRDAAAALALIISLRQSIADIFFRSRPAGEMAVLGLRWDNLSQRLFEIDLALRKLIAVARI
ncbi:MAG: hypothetical protein P9M08_05835 [Candidatus Erginobacter occultus]|nr:hypothetical protein [Candidatus Erginobacter occultus]